MLQLFSFRKEEIIHNLIMQRLQIPGTIIHTSGNKFPPV